MMPPLAMTVSRPFVRCTTSRTIWVLRCRAGAPLMPPDSLASAEVSPLRLSVVFDVITPSMPVARSASSAPSSSSEVRSGASLTRSGTCRPRRCDCTRRSASRGRRRASSALRVCRVRSPGVFGELTLIAR